MIEDNQNKLYLISLKMIKDKYNINSFSIDTFNSIYQHFNSTNNNNLSTNEINKLILKNIDESFKNPPLPQPAKEPQVTLPEEDNDINNKITELRNIRANMINNSSADINNNTTLNNYNDFILNPIQLNGNGNANANANGNVNGNVNANGNVNGNGNGNANGNANGKSFIINTIKNEIAVNNKYLNHNIYPAYLCVPAVVKKYTPYIILLINDNISNISYTFIPDIKNDVWDIWKPVNDNYTSVGILNSNWNINIYDFSNHLLNFNDFYTDIIEVLEISSTNEFNIKVTNIALFEIKDKIKIILKNNISYDNVINKIDSNNIITINKNNLKLEDFINSKVFNYKFQMSLIFKYFPK
uniref:Uncharacterized protein n=1 Tax=viral metagenome TaxID=1070528 RepID=A0A6C0LGF9_9ZZZZ